MSIETDFKCGDCGSSAFLYREDGSRKCKECWWIERTPEQIAQEARWRQQWESEKYLRSE